MATKPTQEKVKAPTVAPAAQAQPLVVYDDVLDREIVAAIEDEATAVKLKDDYARKMFSAGEHLRKARVLVVERARGKKIPNEIGERERFMDYRGPEWAAKLRQHGRTPEWATEVMQWAVDPDAAQARRDARIELMKEQRERTALKLQDSRPGNVTGTKPAQRQIEAPRAKAVSAQELANVYTDIGGLLRRVAVEDRAAALEILKDAREQIRGLV